MPNDSESQLTTQLAVGQRRLQVETLLSGFTALLAIVISAYTVYVQRQQLKAQVWPRIGFETHQIHVDFSNLDMQPIEFVIGVKNRGIAPGELKSFQVDADGGAASKSVGQLLHEAAKKHGFALNFEDERGLTLTSLTGIAIQPGEEVPFIKTTTRRGLAAVLAADLFDHSELCYCSLLGDCWKTRGMTPAKSWSVPSCPETNESTKAQTDVEGSMDAIIDLLVSEKLPDAGPPIRSAPNDASQG